MEKTDAYFLRSCPCAIPCCSARVLHRSKHIQTLAYNLWTFGIKWHNRVRTDEVLQRTGLTSLSNLLSRRRISVFGHVARLDNVTPANMALQLHINVITPRGVALLAVHGASGSTSYETIPHVRLETSGDVLSTVDIVAQRRDGPRWLCELDDDDDDVDRHMSVCVHNVVWYHTVPCVFMHTHASWWCAVPHTVWMGLGISFNHYWTSSANTSRIVSPKWYKWMLVSMTRTTPFYNNVGGLA